MRQGTEIRNTSKAGPPRHMNTLTCKAIDLPSVIKSAASSCLLPVVVWRSRHRMAVHNRAPSVRGGGTAHHRESGKEKARPNPQTQAVSGATPHRSSGPGPKSDPVRTSADAIDSFGLGPSQKHQGSSAGRWARRTGTEHSASPQLMTRVGLGAPP